jgi:hypothetical protein
MVRPIKLLKPGYTSGQEGRYDMMSHLYIYVSIIMLSYCLLAWQLPCIITVIVPTFHVIYNYGLTGYSLGFSISDIYYHILYGSTSADFLRPRRPVYSFRVRNERLFTALKIWPCDCDIGRVLQGDNAHDDMHFVGTKKLPC